MLILFVCVLVGCHDRLSFSSRLISFTVALQSACFQKNETGFEIILSLVFMALHDIAVIRVSKTESVNSKKKEKKRIAPRVIYFSKAWFSSPPLHTHMHAHMHAQHTCMHACTHACTHTHACTTHMHAHMHVHTHTHTHYMYQLSLR